MTNMVLVCYCTQLGYYYTALYLDMICSTVVIACPQHFCCRYYMSGPGAVESDYIKIDYLDGFSDLAMYTNNLTKEYQPDAELWLGETSSGYSGGTRGLSDAYIAGFM